MTKSIRGNFTTLNQLNFKARKIFSTVNDFSRRFRRYRYESAIIPKFSFLTEGGWVSESSIRKDPLFWPLRAYRTPPSSILDPPWNRFFRCFRWFRAKNFLVQTNFWSWKIFQKKKSFSFAFYFFLFYNEREPNPLAPANSSNLTAYPCGALAVSWRF